MRMRVMTYDIWNGGLPVNEDMEDRLEKIVSVIRKHRPDVLCIQEANWFQEQKVDLHLANLLGLPYFSLLEAPKKADGQRDDLLIFSRYKITFAQEFKAGF